jgi:ABC-2 type transport system ATP-binding protein
MDNLFTAQGLTKLYGVVIGVNDVTLDLKPGVIGLLGPNGAGKSTLLKLMTGQIKPTEGTLAVLGDRPWNNMRLMHRIGLCPEQDAFYDSLTGLEFLTILGRFSKLGRHARGKAEETLARIGAAEYMHRPIGEYSKGMRQRTKVAQAVCHDPDLLIFDEPLSGTDPIGRREIMDLIIGLGKEGKSIIVSSHLLHEVQAMTDTFVLIYGGRILASGRVQEIRSLMNEFPHRITLRCGDNKKLAHLLLRDLPVEGVELTAGQSELSVLTRDPKGFYEGLPEMVLSEGIDVQEMNSADDNLESVFNYLISVE